MRGRDAVCLVVDHLGVRHVSFAIEEAIGAPSTQVSQSRSRLPDPHSLLPRDATALGWRLLEGGAFIEAAPYLLAGIKQRPTAFGWCQLGKLFLEKSHPEIAVRCFDEALQLEPANHFAIIDRACALAECVDASSAEIIEAYEGLLTVIGEAQLKRVLWAARVLMQALIRRYPHPELQAQLRTLKTLYHHLGQPGTRAHDALERRLAAVLHVRELLGQRPATATGQVAGRQQHTLGPAGRAA